MNPATSKAQSFEVSPVEEKDLQQEALVASSIALLKPTWRAQRLDIVVSSVLAILNGRGPLDSRNLKNAVDGLWQTGAIPVELFDNALAAAKQAGFITGQHALDGIERLDLTASVKSDLQADQEWVASVLMELRLEVEKRLDEYDDPKLVNKAEKIVSHILKAVACGLVGYGVSQPGAQVALLPADIDEDRVAKYAKTIEPRSQRPPVRDLALAAIDQDEAFGNQVIHLLVAGNVLHGMVAQPHRDPSGLKGIRLLLDTSALTALAARGSPEETILRNAIETSRGLGVDIYVAQHTVEEWNRQWDVADDEAKAITGNTIPLLASRFEKNPFLRAYLEEVGAGRPEDLPYDKWSAGCRNLPRLLDELGVKIISHSISAPEHVALMESIKGALLETGRRSEKGATADACSAVMVELWRRERGPDSAFFVASERFTGEVYKQLIDSQHQLVVPPHIWLIYTSDLDGGDSDRAADLAELVTDTMIRRTMLELASAYTFEEVLAMSEILAEVGPITARDVRELGAATLFDLNELLDGDPSPQEEAARLLVIKARRDRGRADRAREVATRKENAARVREERAERYRRDADQAVAGKDREIQALTHKLELTADDLEKARTQAAAAQAETDARRQLVSRRAWFSGILVLAAVFLASGHLRGWWRGFATLGAGLGLVWFVVVSWDYLIDPSKKLVHVMRLALAEAIVISLGVLFN